MENCLQICSLWPDNGVWYTGVVQEVRQAVIWPARVLLSVLSQAARVWLGQLTVKSMRAKVDYTVTEEVEVLKLAELIDAKQIAFSKLPSRSLACISQLDRAFKTQAASHASS